jgi:SAM-dependent methyltransferase
MTLTEIEPNVYLEGNKLYGDDFGPSEIEAWMEDEREAYASLGAGDASTYEYHYHALNAFHCFGRLPDMPFAHVLGYGSAYGDELRPVAARASKFTIIDPSHKFRSEAVHGVPSSYLAPQRGGELPFDSNEFDLICCFGVLHHIPNVSFLIGEFGRVLRSGGYLLLREPIVSMGDWREPRTGLTMHERGIPFGIFKDAVAEAGLSIERAALCDFALTPRLFRWVRPDVYNSPSVVRFDYWISQLFSPNLRYHAHSFRDRFRPTSAALVAHKAPDAGV